MKDNEIIKALDCCGFEYGNLCSVCPKYEKDNDFCQEELHNYAIDLINRQKEEIKEWKRVVETLVEQHEKDKAEIDGLRADLKRVCAERDAHICTNNFIKSEAVKEFAERLKARIIEDFLKYNTDTTIGYIDNLVKEMAGDTE